MIVSPPVVLATAAALALAGCASASLKPDVQHPIPIESVATVPVDLAAAAAKLNAYRAANGLKPARPDPALTALARRQATAMAAADVVSHDVGGAFGARLAEAGVRPASAYENIGAGYASVDAALIGWKNSPGHNANLLAPDAARFGLAAARNPRSSRGDFWAITLAADPPAPASAASPGWF